MTPPWQPTASLDTIKARAQLYRQLRDFFAKREVLEVETPILGQAATVDPFIESLHTHVLGELRFLQTSPEFFMKRLLAAGSGSIYSLGKVFRQGEQGRKHHPEFTMLEWYRLGWNEQQLIDEVAELFLQLMPELSVTKLSYRECFKQFLQIDPHRASGENLKTLVLDHIDCQLENEPNDTWLDLLMTHCIEPNLPKGLVFIYDYPATQAALAKIDKDEQGQLVAKRFEAYINGMEFANGYWELTDAVEQKNRFIKDQNYKKKYQNNLLPYDKHLVAALESGLPECAGVAVGVDRLLMQACGIDTLQEVLSFDK